jgi:hypothetical protein
MTNMLPRDRAEQILAAHAAGKPVDAIAAEYGHSPQTVRSYALAPRPRRVHGPGRQLRPVRGLLPRRLEDDPHLRAMPLLAEITGPGFPAPARRSTGHWSATR